MAEKEVSQEDQNSSTDSGNNRARSHEFAAHLYSGGHSQCKSLLRRFRSSDSIAADGTEPTRLSNGCESRGICGVSQCHKRPIQLSGSGASPGQYSRRRVLENRATNTDRK